MNEHGNIYMPTQMQLPSVMLILVLVLVQFTWITLLAEEVKVNSLTVHGVLWSIVTMATQRMLEWDVKVNLLIPYCPGQAPIPAHVPPPPILTVLWFSMVLHVTAHHPKSLCSESKGTLSHHLQYTEFPYTGISCCRGTTLWTRPRTGVCKPDVVVPKAHQNNCSYSRYVIPWSPSNIKLPVQNMEMSVIWRLASGVLVTMHICTAEHYKSTV